MPTEKPTITIPDELQQVCKDIAKVAREHKLYNLSGKFQSDIHWIGEVSFNWSAGRHNEDSDEIKIYFNMSVNSKIS